MLRRKKPFADSNEFFILYQKFVREMQDSLYGLSAVPNVLPFLEPDPVEHISKDRERMFSLALAVSKKGGLYGAVADNLWDSIAKSTEYSQQVHLPNFVYRGSEACKEYVDYLFHFERYLKLPKEEIYSVPSLDPDLVAPATVLLDSSDLFRESGEYEKLLNSDLGIIRGAGRKFSIDLSKLSLNFVKKHIPSLKFSTLTIDADTFHVNSSPEFQCVTDTKFETLNDITKKEKLYRLEPGKLPAAQCEALKKLPERIRPKSSYDILRLCANRSGERISPHFHLRIQDEWGYDGGLDSAGFVTIDLNAGPDPVEWIVINDGNYELLKHIYKGEPLDKMSFWKCSLDKLIANKISFRIVNQHMGDIVPNFCNNQNRQ
eukprot:TRINITY_DN135027_c3_g1_i1.p5 TRINITY_DN135027_c3_g1~~TRINITY_DN135027_c3_g1_i1.p5  ORF type:complete len:375 (-),score=38.27 TRINITY_DN135027_c3_g1_i1:6175-7299(-)